MAHSLIAVAETAVDVGSGFSKFLDPVADASAEIEALIAACFSTSAALRNLDEAIEEFEYDRRYERIRRHVAIVKDSLVYTFQDVQRLFGVGLARATILPGLAYRQVWRNVTTHFGQESQNTLERRLKHYQEFIKVLTCMLLEGVPPNHDQFDYLRRRIQTLLDIQEEARLVDDFDRAAIGINRPPSFERVRPREDDLRQPRRGPQREPGRRSPRPRDPMEYGYRGEPYPRRPGGRRPTAYPRDDDDYYYDRNGRPPHVPDPPLSPTGTFSSDSSSSRSIGEHWLPLVFEQGQPPTTLLGTTGQTSIVLGEDMSPEARRALREEYDKLIEIPFESGDLAVRFYYRHNDSRSRIVCRVLHPTRSRKESCQPLTALEVGRSGPFLKFYQRRTHELWACLKFPSYEKLVLFYCTFRALRAEDTINPVSHDRDAELRHEEVVFAGRIIDDHYEHALRLFREEDSGGLRLEASVVSGELRRTPVWTAFITHQIQSRRWMTEASSRVIHLADLQRFIFTENYRPQMAVEGQHELTFGRSEGKILYIPRLPSTLTCVDARQFMRLINRLADEEED